MQQQDQADVEIDVLLQDLADEHCTAFAVDPLQSTMRMLKWLQHTTLQLNKFCCCDCVSLLYSCVSEAPTTFCLNSERVQLSCHLEDSNHAVRLQSTTQHVSL